MPARGLRGLLLRGFTAAAAGLLALGSTGALVAAATVAPAGAVPAIAMSQGISATYGNPPTGPPPFQPVRPAPPKPTPTPRHWKHKPTAAPTPAPTPVPTHKPAPHPKPAAKLAPAPHPATPATPAPTARVVVDSSDPAPFSAESVAATDAARVLPVESLGPLSGVSFGNGLLIWPLLLAVDVFALAVIARMALRRRLASPED